MTREVYESPRMDFEEVTTTEAVANTCWGYHGTNTKLYVDIDGPGWVSFQIGGGSCKLKLTNVLYYKNKSDSGTRANSSQIEELESILINSGGESGNPYAGEGSTVIPDDPSPEFS